MNWRRLARKAEFGDLLLLLYALAFVREYAWAVSNHYSAWILTIGVAIAGWTAYITFKPDVSERTPRVFWLIVGLPLLFVFSWRVLSPDLSFDVLNHRLIQAERALRGVQLLPGDFFPNVFPFNPVSDMVTGISRHLLGYRLGTIVNLLALLWTATILEKLLRRWIPRQTVRCAGVLLIVFTEHVLFEINNYMVDLLALPLLLEATRLGLNYDESDTKRWDISWSALLLGGALALKLTNAAMVAPVVLLIAARAIAKRDKRQLPFDVLLAAVLFLLPLLPHAIYIYRETGSPFFPLYNDIFHSPYWPEIRMFDGRWGPHTRTEISYWPIVSTFVPHRLSELSVYSGRILLGFLAALLCLVLRRIEGRVRLIAGMVLVGSWLWSATSGYIRYTLFIELLSGLLILHLAVYLLRGLRAAPRAARLGLGAIPLVLLIGQNSLAAIYVWRTEWGGRPISSAATLKDEAPLFFRDRSLPEFQSEETLQSISRVDAWIVSSVKSNGVEVLLRPDVPMLGVVYNEYFDPVEGRRRFARALDNVRGKRVYSITLRDELPAAIEALSRRNLRTGTTQDVVIPFFSQRTGLHMVLIEVIIPPKTGAQQKPPGQPPITDINGPLNDDAFVANVSVQTAPTIVQHGQSAQLTVTVRNDSDFVWPARSPTPKFAINVSDSWYRADGRTLVTNLDARAGLPHDLWPGESAAVPLTIVAPSEPGEYVLEIDLVQEAVSFFKDRGSRTWRAPLIVK